MADALQITMTPEEFFAWDPGDENRYELVDGIPVMMAGASIAHDRIVINLIASFHGQLRGSGCVPMTADIGLRTRIRNVRRPDVMIACDEPTAKRYEALDARMAVEVLSPSNTGVAWQRKLEEYRQHKNLQYILLIDPLTVAATLLTREGPTWTSSDYDTVEEVIELSQIDCRLAMSDVYDGLDLSGGPDSRQDTTG